VDAYVRDHFGERHQRAELADPSLITLVAVPQTSTSDTLAGEPLAAYAQLVRPAAPRGTAELARLYVHPRWQGQRLAAALLGAVVDPRGRMPRSGSSWRCTSGTRVPSRSTAGTASR
jgi:GNAT superfamily N-acetyltransferase